MTPIVLDCPPMHHSFRRHPFISIGLAGLLSLQPVASLLAADDDVVVAISEPKDATTTSLATFDQRRQACLDAVWDYYQSHIQHLPPGFPMASALFAMGKVAEGRRMADRSLDQFVPGNRENRWMFGGNSGFGVWPGIDCYIRHEAQLGDELKQRFRAIYTGGVFYQRLTTSNHKIMAATTRYLATQVWGESAFRPDPFFHGEHDKGNYFSADDHSGEAYVRATIESTLRDGPGEYASRPYGAENLLPLLTLAECAKDAVIAGRARLAYEYGMIQLAPAWLHGHLNRPL